MKLKRQLSWFLLLVLATTLNFSACKSDPADTGSAELGVSAQALSSADVDHVTITVSGNNISPDIVRNLHFSQGQWKGIIGGIPAGTDRTFLAQAFDASDALIYTGDATDVEIIQGEKASVVILLQQETAPDPFENAAPTIDSLVASSHAVSMDDPINLAVTASDVDPEDTLTYAWTATDGTFDDAASTTPVWTAPASAGLYTLTIEVTDSKNAMRTVSLNVDVQLYHGRGRAGVEVDFNTWPEVAEVNANPTRLNVNGLTNLTVIATDNDSDILGFAWADNGGECSGTFSYTEIQNPTWTAPASLPSAEVCILTVTVTDGRGGSNTGELTINMGEEEDPNIAPTFITTYQSSEEAANTEVVYLNVEASDADGDDMTFSWAITSGNGTLDNQTDTSTTSDIDYTSDGNAVTVTATVTDANNAYTEQEFIVNSGILPPAEFQVNTYTTGGQAEPWLAMATDGSFVVIWTSWDQDGDLGGIYGQRFDSNRNPVSSEFRVNTYTTNRQEWSSVAMADDGTFVAVWQSLDQNGSHYEIYGQRYDSSGNPAGSEFLVNTHTTNSQQNPSIAMKNDGSFIVIWSSFGQDGSEFGIYGQRYDTSGNTIGSEFQVNTHTARSQYQPSIAMKDDGSFVVVWSSWDQDGSEYGIYGQRYDSSGNTVGSEFKVSTYTTGAQFEPSIAMTGSGSFIVVWSSFGQDGSDYGIYGQRYDSSGNTVGSEFQINTYTADAQIKPSIAMKDDGSFVVIWSSGEQDGDSGGIYGQRHDSNGNTVDSEFQVNTYTSNDQRFPSVAMASDGSFVVVWDSRYQDGDNWGIYGKSL